MNVSDVMLFGPGVIEVTKKNIRKLSGAFIISFVFDFVALSFNEELIRLLCDWTNLLFSFGFCK